MLETKYFLNLLQFIGQTSKDQTKQIRDKNVKERREHYKKDEWEAYEAIVKKNLEFEDQACQAILKEVIETLQISEQEFGMTHQLLAQNPQTAEFVMAA